MRSVGALLEASHTVRLRFSLCGEWIKNGNVAKPAVRMVPVGTNQLAAKAARVQRNSSSHQGNSKIMTAKWSGEKLAPYRSGHTANAAHATQYQPY